MRVVAELGAARACSGLEIPLLPGLTGYAVIEKLRIILVQVDRAATRRASHAEQHFWASLMIRYRCYTARERSRSCAQLRLSHAHSGPGPSECH